MLAHRLNTEGWTPKGPAPLSEAFHGSHTMGGLPQRASLFAQKCVGGVWFCFSASSKEQSRSCLQLQPLTNEVLNPSSNWSKLHTAFETNPIRLNSSRLLQSSYSFLRSTKTEAAAANQKQQQQQQPWSMGPRSSASKLPQILDPSPLWKLPSPKNKFINTTK